MSLTGRERDYAAVISGGAAPERAAFIRRMFDDIAPRYDLVNDTLSAGVHRGWRDFASRCAGLSPGDSVLDVCSGTGAWLPLLRRCVGPRGRVAGADFSLPMLRHGAAVFSTSSATAIAADTLHLPMREGAFDAVTCGFGVRNLAGVEAGLREIYRVLRPGGRFVCLEFSQPPPGVFRAFYGLYSKYLMPLVGGLLSGRRDAYRYLPESAAAFRTRTELADLMREAGFAPVRWVDLTFGLVCVHVATRPGYPVSEGGR